MVNFKRLTNKAKDVVDKRGGVDSLKGDATELREIAKGKGSLKDKAKAAGKAIKDPGRRGLTVPSARAPSLREPARGRRAQHPQQVARRSSALRPRRGRAGVTPPPAR